MDARLRTAPRRCSLGPMAMKITHATGFDTLSYARRLKAAGVDEAQAEAHAEAVRDAVAEGVATKDDLDKGLAAAKVDLDTGLTALRTDLDNGLAAVKADIARVENRMATKAELAEVKAELAEAKAELKTDVANLETRLTVRFVGIAVGIVLANAGLTFGLLKLLLPAAG